MSTHTLLPAGNRRCNSANMSIAYSTLSAKRGPILSKMHLLLSLVVVASAVVNVVIVGQGAFTIGYSTDGLSYTGAPGSTSVFQTQGNGVAYGLASNMWVAVGQGNTFGIASSSDGISWTGQSAGTLTIGWGVAWSDAQSLWVAVGQGSNSIAFSSDGTSWTGLGTSVFSIGYGVAYSAALNLWVAVGAPAAGFPIASSPDGRTWTVGQTLVRAGLATARSVYYSAATSLWVAVGDPGTSYTMVSSDGMTWTNGAAGNPSFGGNAYAVTYTGSQWLVGGNGGTVMYSSTNGAFWTPLGANPVCCVVQGLAYSTILNLIIAVGRSGSQLSTSPNGVTWTGSPSASNQVLSYGFGVGVRYGTVATTIAATTTAGVAPTPPPGGTTVTAATTSGTPVPGSGNNMGLIIGIAVAVPLVVIAAIIVVALLLYRKRKSALQTPLIASASYDSYMTSSSMGGTVTEDMSSSDIRMLLKVDELAGDLKDPI